ncbi:MAG TPA: alanyl-tRNA editing protein [Kofleriaceae bacterium]|nr:alanyl-tRNA editing protein [Kofleriaceae bacterium]
MTQRLYHEDAYLRRFEGEVLAVTAWKDRPAVVLDRTAFYPEAGGQLGDRGTLGGVPVLDTQEAEAGIVHVLGGAPPAVGARVAGEIDWARRRQHMAQHTAQHLLSGALLDRAAAPTASARLGESALTIDVARDRVPDAELAAAEDLANDLIDDDLPVRAWFPPPDELARLTLRRDPKVDADIRVVAIGEFDLSPCGGTHCARTSQLGVIRIVSAERYKGMTRVTFTAARRGRAELFSRDGVLRGLAAQFSCGPAEVPQAIDKLRRDAEAAGAELTALRGRLAGMVARELLAGPGAGPIVASLPGDPELLRGVGAKLVAAGRDAILCAPEAGGSTVVLFRAPGSALDCAALWKRLAAEVGGRGGGRSDRAEGRLARSIDDWSTLVERLGA